MKTSNLSLLLCALTLQGCANWFTPVGENKFDCNRRQDPNSPYCKSFKAVEGSTNGSIPDSRFDEVYKLSDYDKLMGIAPVKKIGVKADGVPTTPLLPHLANTANEKLEGRPVREAAVVQRVWIKRFVDENDQLIDGVVVYREVIGTRWTGFGETDASRMRGVATYPHKPPADLQPATTNSSMADGTRAPTVSTQINTSATANASSPPFKQPLDIPIGRPSEKESSSDDNPSTVLPE